MNNNEFFNNIQKLRGELECHKEPFPYDPELINATEALLRKLKDNMSPSPAISKSTNKVSKMHAIQILEEVAKTLCTHTVAGRYGTLKQLFRDCNTYGFKFSFITSFDILNTELPEYNENDYRIIKDFKIQPM